MELTEAGRGMARRGVAGQGRAGHGQARQGNDFQEGTMEMKLKALDGSKTKIMQRSPFTDDIIRELRKVAIGGSVTYDDLSAAIGMKVQGSASLGTARKTLLKEGIVFRTAKGVGIVRADVVERASLVADHHRKTHRAAERTLEVAATVDPMELPKEKRISFEAVAAAAGAAAAITSTRGLRRIEEKTKNSLERLPVGKTLDALKE
jgi:hypothetical protein